jgi:hypothetical protein
MFILYILLIILFSLTILIGYIYYRLFIANTDLEEEEEEDIY